MPAETRITELKQPALDSSGTALWHSRPESRTNSGRELAGLRALVTGATGGIGRAIALELAAGGADVIVHGRRQPAADEVSAHARRRGVRAEALLADLTETERLPALVEAAWAVWGGLDVWV